MKTLRQLVLAGLVLVVSCSAPVEPTSSGHHRISIPGLTPEPCDGWEGDEVRLLVADALTGCSADPSGVGFDTEYYGNDPYLAHIVDKMGAVFPTPTPDLFGSWATLRETAAQNCDPVTGAKATVGVFIERSAILETIAIPPSTPSADIGRYRRADAHLRQAGINLCIAQRLRSRSPGASAGEDLLLPDSAQRTLLETIRERAQIAMLQYALLGAVFATPRQTLPPGLHFPSQTIPILQAWPMTTAPGQLREMGRDFAAAVQLHSVVSEELLQLLARNKSARSPYGGSFASRAEQVWGPGSWHQRLLAAAFGGDPLAPLDKGTPWTHWDPDRGLSGQAGVESPSNWPEYLNAPYVTAPSREVQIGELMRLARQHDLVDLVKDTSPASCELYDAAATARDLYKRIEAEVRVADCYRASPSDPCPTVPVQPVYEYGQGPYLLFEKYRITPSHALTLATVLIQSVGGRKSTTACGVDSFENAHFGARNLRGTLADDSTGARSHLNAAVRFSNFAVPEVAPSFTRFASTRLTTPWEIDFLGYWDVFDVYLGFDEVCNASGCSIFTTNADAKRIMGAVSAQAAVRDVVVETLAYLGSGYGQPPVVEYFGEATQILGLLDASVGEATVSVRAEVEENPPLLQVRDSRVQVKVLAPPNDPWWEWTSTAYNLVVAINDPRARTLSADPETSINGVTLLDLAVSAVGAEQFGFGASYVPPAPSGITGLPRIWLANLKLPNTLAPKTYTFVAVRVDTAAPPESVITYRPLGVNMRVVIGQPQRGQYLGIGGSLNAFVAQQLAVRDSNPSEPAIDGFGLPTAWVPPTNAELIGGSAEETSTSVYLRLAKQSAETARSAVESALQDLAQQQQDDATKGIAAGRAAAGIAEDKDRLCGANNPNCDTSVSPVTIVNQFTDCTPSGPPGEPAQIKCALDHFVFQVADDASKAPIAVATPVSETLGEPTVPAFKEYQGGSLQQSFVEQWQAFNAIRGKFDLLAKAAQAARSSVDLAHAALIQVDQEIVNNCSNEALQGAINAGYQVEIGHIYTDWYVSFSYDSDGPMTLAAFHAQVQACKSASTSLQPATVAILAARDAAFMQLGSAGVLATEAVAAARVATAVGTNLVAEAKLADKRHELEVSLTKQGLQTSFSVYRIARGYDLWRAKALVENSRRYSLAARRSIEAMYVVNLSELDGDEAFVASPKSWADEVYGYDLTLPAAVGLTLSGGSGGDAIYPNKLNDHVANLEAFINGYSASRPTAVANNDIDVVTLPGLMPGEAVEIPLDPMDPNSPTITGFPDRGSWLVRCKVGVAAPEWVPYDGLGCDGTIDRAKLVFSLDPWGRVNGSIANEPFEKRFNARWGLLAVNFVGTGIRDCQNAIDPKGCYSEAFIRYNLTQVGQPWVTDYDGVWRGLDFPMGRIEGGKALAAELWLDPLKDGWSTSYISAVARSEWRHRPLGGSYELEFEVSPDVRLERIERLQLLVGSSSWVKQQ